MFASARFRDDRAPHRLGRYVPISRCCRMPRHACFRKSLSRNAQTVVDARGTLIRLHAFLRALHVPRAPAPAGAALRPSRPYGETGLSLVAGTDFTRYSHDPVRWCEHPMPCRSRRQVVGHFVFFGLAPWPAPFGPPGTFDRAPCAARQA